MPGRRAVQHRCPGAALFNEKILHFATADAAPVGVQDENCPDEHLRNQHRHQEVPSHRHACCVVGQPGCSLLPTPHSQLRMLGCHINVELCTSADGCNQVLIQVHLQAAVHLQSRLAGIVTCGLVC